MCLKVFDAKCIRLPKLPNFSHNLDLMLSKLNFKALFLLLPFWTSNVHAQITEVPIGYTDSALLEVQKTLSIFVNDPVFAHASIGFQAVDVTTGQVLASHQSLTTLSPASTTKLFATATAFQVLGKEYMPKTRIYVDGPIDKNGVLTGNLWIRGAGDVSLGSRYYNEDGQEALFLAKWADTLLKMGIKQVNGAVISDASEFGYKGVPDGWSWDDIGNYYGAGPSGLPIFDNAVKYVFKSGNSFGSKTTLLETIPNVPGLTFRNTITSGAKGDNSYLYGAPYSLDRFGIGTITPKAARFVVKGSMPDSESQFALELFKYMKLAGIVVRDSVKGARSLTPQLPTERYANMKQVIEFQGRTVGSIAWWTNMKSVNLFAEQLLCWVGYGTNGIGTTENGVAKMMEYWTGKIPTSGLMLKDGSGLSRSNAISAQHFCDLLRYMQTSPHFETFYGTLPIAGVSGTLSSVCKNQLAQGRLRAKSGTMRKIKSYAGYVETISGKKIAFAIIVNNYDCSSEGVVDRMEKLFNTMTSL